MALWTPADIATELWLDVDDASTITESGGFISQWDDKSGHARHVLSTGSGRPTLTPAAQNGLPAVEFSGAQYLSQGSGNADIDFSSKEISMFVVLKSDRTSEVSEGLVAIKRPGAYDFYHSILERRTTNYALDYGDGGDGGFTLSRLRIERYANSDTTDYNILGGTINTTAAISYLNGVAQTDNLEAGTMAQSSYLTSIGATSCYATLGARVMEADNGYDSYFDGKIGEAIITTSVLSAADRENIEGYLAWKWGLEAKLPAGHPYKDAAPLAPTDPNWNQVVSAASFFDSLDDQKTGGIWTLPNPANTNIGTPGNGRWGGAGLTSAEGTSGGALNPAVDPMAGYSTQDFTLDMWYTASVLPTGGDFDYLFDYSTELVMFLYQSQLYIRDKTGAELVTPVTWPLDGTTYGFMRFIRYDNAGTWTNEIWLDGVLLSSGTGGTLVENAAAQIRLLNSGGTTHNANGLLSDFRATLGGARSGTEVPTGPFPTSGPTASDPLFDEVRTLIHADDADGTLIPIDETGVIWTRVGTPVVSYAQSKWPPGSLSYPGGASYYENPADTYNFGAGDFTVEGWFRPSVSQGGNKQALDFRVSLGSSMVIWFSQSGQTNRLGYSDENGISFTASAIPWVNATWQHFAITREAGVIKGWVGGALGLTASDARTFVATGMRLGSDASGLGIIGNLDDVRVTEGTARYTAPFTPPTAPFPDSGPVAPTGTVISQLPLDGAAGTTAFIDQIPSVIWTRSGGAAMSNAVAGKYGPTSLICVGTTDAIRGTPLPTEIGTQDFTIEGYFLGGVSSVVRILWDFRATNVDPVGGLLYLSSDIPRWYLNGADVLVATSSITDGVTWVEIAYSRVDGVGRIFINGTQSGPDFADTTDYVFGGGSITYGNGWAGGGAMAGFLDMMRVRVGPGAGYATDYTPHTAPWPDPTAPVDNPPVVTGPDDTVVTEFTDATFIVSATGDSPFTYQWYKAPNILLTGETTDTLILTNVQFADTGSGYFCTVTDVNTLSTDSRTATLTVNEVQAPIFTTQPQDVFLLDGETGVFTVAATGTAPLTYQWYEVTAGLLAGETSTTLSIVFAAADAGKQYYCIVTDGNAKTTQSTTATVTIVTVPVFTTNPSDYTVIEFRDAMFGASANGNGPFVYDWYNDVDGLVAPAGGTLYAFTPTLADDGKNYYAIVTDVYDNSAQSTSALLTVTQSYTANTPPFIDSDIVGPGPENVPFGRSATLEVQILNNIAVEPVVIDWYNDVDGLILADGGTEYSFLPTVADQGKNYFVVVTDSLGQVGQGQLGLLTLQPAELNLSWSVANAKPDGTLIKYQSIAWSVFDAYAVAEIEAFRCPVRAHRGLDDEGRTYWIPFYDKSARASRGPLVNDAYNRYYWTQDNEDARYAPLENLKLDTCTTGVVLGVPAPVRKPLLQKEIATDAADLETRSYVYTYVTVYGEEGPPSEPVTATGDGQGRWTLSNMEKGPLDGKRRRITIKRVYRTITGATGATDYYLVTSLPLTVTKFVDRKANSQVVLNNVLESYNWFPPPEGLSGLIAHPNGFFVGFVGRDIYFSEPYRPHAWNPAYVVSTVPDVVGFGIFGSTVVVCTESYPYTLTGIHPGAMAFNQHDTPEPCVSRYGIVSMPFGVYFPGPNGLMLASPQGFQNATKELMTKEEWQNRYQVRNLDAAQYQSQYVAFYNSTKGVMFAPDERMAALVDLDLTGAAAEPDQMDTIFTDEYSGKTFLIDSCTMYEWNPVSGAPLEFDWTSMEFDSADPINFGAARIIWYSRYTPPTAEETTLWRNYNVERMAAAPLNPFNFHAVNSARQVNPVGYEDFPEIKQPFSWSPLIWVPVEGEPWPNTPYVIMELIANEEVVFTQEIVDTDIFRLPSGWKSTRFKIRLRSNVPIQSCKMTETGKELSRI